VGAVQIAGWVLIAIVTGNAALLLISSLRRSQGERRQQRLALELLQQQVAAAAVLRQEAEQARFLWEGFRKFVVSRKVEEGENIASLYLVPFDRKPLPSFRPGQFLTFQFKIPGQARPVVRCYSLSDSFHPDYYRVTIKRALPPPSAAESPAGLVSSFVHDQLQVGEILDVQSPRGEFTLDLQRMTPVVLIAGGIGLTPMLCMLNALVERGSPREVWLFYGVRNGREAVMKDYLRKLSQERERFRLRFCFSRPAADEIAGTDYDHGECISLGLLQKELESNNYEFYICGPSAMMASVTDGLKQWGVPERRIFSEAFGPASVPKKSAPEVRPSTGAAVATGPRIVFSRSGKSANWESSAGSLLEFAQSNGVSIPAGCCAGNCGTCETAIRSGTVSYLKEPGWKPQTGTCLVCVATPSADLELDA